LKPSNWGVLIQQAGQEKSTNNLAEWNEQILHFKPESDLKDVRFSTLQRIIKDGPCGQLQISIKF